MTVHYDFDWHVRHRDRNAHSANRVAELLLPLLPIRSVVDFACGDGTLLRTMQVGVWSGSIGYDGPLNDPDRLLIDRSLFRVVDLSECVAASEALVL